MRFSRKIEGLHNSTFLLIFGFFSFKILTWTRLFFEKHILGSEQISFIELHQINLTFDQMTFRQISSNCFDQVIKISFFDQIIFIRFWWILTIWWKFDTFWSHVWPKRQNLKIWSKIIWSNHQTSNDIWRFDATLKRKNERKIKTKTIN